MLVHLFCTHKKTDYFSSSGPLGNQSKYTLMLKKTGYFFLACLSLAKLVICNAYRHHHTKRKRLTKRLSCDDNDDDDDPVLLIYHSFLLRCEENGRLTP